MPEISPFVADRQEGFMRVRCDYCGVWFDPEGNVLGTYCPHCNRWSCEDCYLAASEAWFKEHGCFEEYAAGMRAAEGLFRKRG